MKREDSFKSNVAFAITSNLTIAIVSTLSILVLPKFLGVHEYGYWQLFIFYSSYALLLQLGAGDGANLRYAGLKKENLLNCGLGLQASVVFFLTLVLSAGIFVMSSYFIDDGARMVVLQLTALYAPIVNLRHFLLLQMQATGNFRTFSKITIIDRVSFVALVVILLTFEANYVLLAGAELLSKFFTLIIALVSLRQILGVRRNELFKSMKQFITNITAGIKLTIANTSNMLILGVARFLIDRTFGVVIFGAISLALNLSAFFMIFVKAVGVVLLPTLRRSDQKQLPKVFETVRLPLSVFPLILLVVAYPLIELLSRWLPEYQKGISYLSVLIIIIAFETKMSLLVDPFLKTLRKENALLIVNLIALLISTILSVLSTVVMQSLDLAVLSIVISLGVRALVAEILLLEALGLKMDVATLSEFLLVFVSVFFNFVIGGWPGTIMMAVLVAAYLTILRKSIISKTKIILRLARSK